MAFDPQKHLLRLEDGTLYLPVAWRIVWFREEHADWAIVAEPVAIDVERQYAIFKATILDENGKVIATATKMENAERFADYLEGAETAAIGRALALCGYGTPIPPERE